jgi:ABC-type phosphate transport system auxiliary subunit
LMSPTVARQIEASRLQVAKPSEVLSLNELYGSLQGAIWEEVRKGTNTDQMRRSLQRDHLRRVTAAITGPAQAMSADARSVLRAQARQLRDQLASAQKAGSLDAETRAHYAESYEALNEALRATMVRATG